MATVEFKMTTAGPGVSSSFKSKSRIQVTYTAGNGKITIQSIKGRRTDGNYGNYSNNSNNYLNLTINGVTKKVKCKLIDFRGSSWQAWTNFTDQTWTGLNGSYTLKVYISCTSSFVTGSTFSGSINAGYSSYTLTYNANGGSVSPTSKSVASNATLGTLPTPSRTGYTFAGWFTAASGGTQVSSSTVMGAGNRTIYAHWNLNYYTLTFNANGGSVSPTSRSVGYGQTYGTLPTPSWTGRTFQGWFTAASGGSQVYSSTTMGAGSRTIYAHWSLNSYKQIIYVRYMNSSGSYGSYSAVINTNYNYGSTCSWSRAADSVYNAASISYTVTGANTKYVDVTRKQYTLTLNPNQGTYNNSTATYSTTNYAERTISLSIPEKDNYQYFGFAKTSGSGTYGDMYTFGDPASYNQIEVSVYDNNSSGQVSITRETRSADNPLPNTYQLKITTSGTGTTPGYGGFHRQVMSVSGKKFYHTFLAKVPVGYTLNIANNAIGDGGTLIWVTNNKGTGNWEVYEYEVTCGTSGSFSTFGFIYLTGGSLPVTWYLGTSNVSRQDISEITYNFQTSNTNLIANYIPNYYCVQFNANGGNGSMDILNCYYGATRTLPNNQFTKDTYKFVGWNTKADGTGTSYLNQQQISNLTTTNRAFITLYAQWELDSLTISFDGMGGENVPNEVSYTYSESGTIILPDNILTKSHYGFLGWDTDPSGTTVVYKRGAEYPKSIQENVTLYAVWAPQIRIYLKDQGIFKLGYLWTMKDGKWKIGIESFGKDNIDWQTHQISNLKYFAIYNNNEKTTYLCANDTIPIVGDTYKNIVIDELIEYDTNQQQFPYSENMVANTEKFYVLDKIYLNVLNLTFVGQKRNEIINLTNFKSNKVFDLMGTFAFGTLPDNFQLPNWKINSMSASFMDCTCNSLDLSQLDISNANTLELGANNIREINLSNWNFPNLSASQILFGFSNLEKVTLNNIDTTRLTGLGPWFADTKLTHFDLAKLQFDNILGIESFLAGTNITNFNFPTIVAPKITIIRYLLVDSQKLQTVTSDNNIFPECTHFEANFGGCPELTTVDLSKLSLPKCQSIERLFASTPKLKTLQLPQFSNSLQWVQSAFEGSGLETIDLSSIDGSNIASMEDIFRDCDALSIIKLPKNLSSDTYIANCTSKTFYDTDDNYKEYPAGTIPLGFAESHTLVSEVPSVKLITGSDFNSKLTSLYDSSDSITKIVFSQDEVPTNVTTIDVSKDQDGSAIAWTSGDGTITVTSKTQGTKIIFNENSSGMFANLSYIESINFGENIVNTSNVTDMGGMFAFTGEYADSWTLKGIENWDTTNVTVMGDMFSSAGSNCATFSLDLSKWNVPKVTYMAQMFGGAGQNATTWTLKTPINIPNNADRTLILDGLTVYDANNNYSLMDQDGSDFPTNNPTSHTLVNKIPVTHNITYNLEGGVLPDNAPTSYVEGEGLSELPIPTKDGYTFIGWYDPNSEYITDGINTDRVTHTFTKGDARTKWNLSPSIRKENISYIDISISNKILLNLSVKDYGESVHYVVLKDSNNNELLNLECHSYENGHGSLLLNPGNYELYYKTSGYYTFVDPGLNDAGLVFSLTKIKTSIGGNETEDIELSAAWESNNTEI